MGLLEQAQQGGSMTPQLAEAAAQAGAPSPDAGAAAPTPPAPTAAGGQNAPAAPANAAAPAPAPGQQATTPLPEEEALPEEQAEYERGMGAVAKVLYGNDTTSNAIVDQIDPNDKIGSTAKVAILFIRELDRKVNLAETTIAPITQEVTERIAELAEARHNIQYTPDEVEKVLGATWEGVVAMFGSDGGPEGAQSFAQFAQGFDSDALAQLKQEHEARLNG